MTSSVSFPTALGRCAIRWSEAGVTGVALPSARPHPGPALEDGAVVPEGIRAAIDGITSVMAGDRRDLREVALDEGGLDDFRRAVYAATREIGPGTTRSYGEVARAIGRPGDARDVGAALARNPFPIVVPCHRVLRTGGHLGGYGGGLPVKVKLLELESTDQRLW